MALRQRKGSVLLDWIAAISCPVVVVFSASNSENIWAVENPECPTRPAESLNHHWNKSEAAELVREKRLKTRL